MKLNYRDAVILGIVLALAVLLAGFFFAIKPKNDDIKSNKASLETLEQERAQVDAKIAEIEPLKTDITQLYNDTTGLINDFVEYNNIVNSRKIDQYMQHFAEEAEVKIMNLSSADPTSGALSYYYFTPSFLAEDMLAQSDLNGERSASKAESLAESDALAARTQETVMQGQYSITVEGEKENLWKYMELLEEQDETIIINSVNFTNLSIKDVKTSKSSDDEEEQIPSAQFVITLYSVYDLAEPNLEAD